MKTPHRQWLWAAVAYLLWGKTVQAPWVPIGGGARSPSFPWVPSQLQIRWFHLLQMPDPHYHPLPDLGSKKERLPPGNFAPATAVSIYAHSCHFPRVRSHDIMTSHGIPFLPKVLWHPSTQLPASQESFFSHQLYNKTSLKKKLFFLICISHYNVLGPCVKIYYISGVHSIFDTKTALPCPG